MKTTWKQKGRRTGERKPLFSKRERKRLIQLGVSIVIFTLALLGRSIVPDQVAQWNDLLRQDTDFKAAFAQLGEATAQGEPILDALEELCVEVFAGGSEIRETGGAAVFEEAPSITQRSRIWQEEQWTKWQGR